LRAASVAALEGRGGGRGRKTVCRMTPHEPSPLSLVFLLLGSFSFILFWLHVIRRRRKKERKRRRRRRETRAAGEGLTRSGGDGGGGAGGGDGGGRGEQGGRAGDGVESDDVRVDLQLDPADDGAVVAGGVERGREGEGRRLD